MFHSILQPFGLPREVGTGLLHHLLGIRFRYFEPFGRLAGSLLLAG